MDTQIRHSPSAAVVTFTLAPGESVRSEAGAMTAMAGVEIETTSGGGGIGKALKRSLLGGESFFMNTFTAGPQGGWVQLGPTLMGDVQVVEMAGQSVLVQSGAFLAAETTIDVDTKWGGAKGFFSGTGMFLLHCTGTGKLALASYGALDSFSLDAGQAMTVDTGHIVKFDESVQFNVRRIGNWKSTFLSGEGLVCELAGPGTVMTQTRSRDALESWIKGIVPANTSGS